MMPEGFNSQGDMMKCPNLEQLFDTVGNESADPQIALHAKICPTCAAEISRMQETLGLFLEKRTTPPKPAVQLSHNAVAAVAQSRRTWASTVALTASILAVATFVLFVKPTDSRAVKIAVTAQVSLLRSSAEPSTPAIDQTREGTFVVPSRTAIMLNAQTTTESTSAHTGVVQAISVYADGTARLHPPGNQAGPFVLQPGETRTVIFMSMASKIDELPSPVNWASPGDIDGQIWAWLSINSPERLGLETITLNASQ